MVDVLTISPSCCFREFTGRYLHQDQEATMQAVQSCSRSVEVTEGKQLKRKKRVVLTIRAQLYLFLVTLIKMPYAS